MIDVQVTSVVMSSDSRRLLTLGRDDTLKIVDIATFEVVQTLTDQSFHAGVNWSQV